MKQLLSSLFLIGLLLPLKAQTTRELVGRVVEVANGISYGVPKITVTLSDNFDYDITDDNGNFKLVFPPDRDFVTVMVENSPNKMISPPSGLVNLPPSRNLQIVLCAEANQKLLAQVDGLNSRMKKLEKQNNLSKRQLAALHATLLDTILFFENTMARMEQDARQQKNETAGISAALKAKDAQIRGLQDSLTVLVQALSQALESRFLKQKEYFNQISGDLLEYADRLKDLRDQLQPPRISQYFANAQAMNGLNKTTIAYNDAREIILKSHKGHLAAIQQYWDAPDAAETLAETYQFLFENVHKAHVLPLNERVIGAMQKFYGGQLGQGSAQKEAKKGAESILPDLAKDILELERQIQKAINALSKNI